MTLTWAADYSSAQSWSAAGWGNAQYQVDNGSIVNGGSVPAGKIEPATHATLGNSLKFVCGPSDERAEVTPPDNLNDFPSGADAYFRFDFVLDSNFEINTGNYWHIIAQIHGDDTASPPLEFDVHDGGLYTRGYSGGTYNRFLRRLFDVTTGTKYSVIYRARFSTTAATNLVQVWLNGTLVLDEAPGYPLVTGAGSYVKFGLYRDIAFTSTEGVWQSNHAIGTTYNDVANLQNGNNASYSSGSTHTRTVNDTAGASDTVSTSGTSGGTGGSGVPVIREVVGGATTGAGTGGTTVSTSSAVAVNDLLLGFHAIDWGDPTTQFPAPTPGTWSQIATDNRTANNNTHLRLWARRATAGGVQTINFPGSSANPDVVPILVVIDGSTIPSGTWLDAAGGGGGGTATTGVTAHVAPGVTTTGANRLMLTGHATGSASPTPTYTAPSGMTLVDTRASTYERHSVYKETRASAGATGTRTATASATGLYSTVTVTVIGAASTTQSGSAALAGVGSMGGAVYQQWQVAAQNMTGVGALAGALTITVQYVPPFTGVGTLGPDATRIITDTAGGMSGVGALTVVQTESTADLPPGGFDGVGLLGPAAATAVSGPQSHWGGEGSLGGPAELAAGGGGTLDGEGTLAGEGQYTAAAEAALTGEGSLAASALLGQTTFMAGSGQLYGAAEVIPGGGAMAGVSTLGAAALPVVKVAGAALTGTGSISALAGFAIAESVAMEGYGTLGALSGIAAVSWTPVFVRPRGPVRPQVPVPRTTLLVCETRTGKVLTRLPYTALSWTSALNKIPTCSSTLKLDEALDSLADQRAPDPRSALRAILVGEWRFSLVPCYGSVPLMGGPLLPSEDLSAGKVAVGGLGMERMLEKRILSQPGTGDLADPSRDISYIATTVRGAIYRLVNEAMLPYQGRTSRQLPITCSNPPRDLFGLRDFSWPSYDLTKAWKAITELLADAEGPDIRLEPYLTDTDDGPYVYWDLQIGSPALPASGVAGPTGPMPWTFAPVRDEITRSLDAAGMATSVYVSGEGQDRAKLIAKASSDELSLLGWPDLEEVEGAASSGVGSILATDQVGVQRLADGALAAYKGPTNSVSIKVQVDGTPNIGQLRRGDTARIDTRGSIYLEPGFEHRRITQIAGGDGRTATVTCELDDDLVGV